MLTFISAIVINRKPSKIYKFSILQFSFLLGFVETYFYNSFFLTVSVGAAFVWKAFVGIAFVNSIISSPAVPAEYLPFSQVYVIGF